ncbi:hypothetical protein KC341_g61 [Hortaea werneckii]|nr:hypothetical protein KC341_g61 [Hortaea werneckii]
MACLSPLSIPFVSSASFPLPALSSPLQPLSISARAERVTSTHRAKEHAKPYVNTQKQSHHVLPHESLPLFCLSTPTRRQRPPPLQLNRVPDPQLVDEVVMFDARGTFGGEFVEGGLERVAEAFDQVGHDEEACAVET